jgi:hypothetical protein
MENTRRMSKLADIVRDKPFYGFEQDKRLEKKTS